MVAKLCQNDAPKRFFGLDARVSDSVVTVARLVKQSKKCEEPTCAVHEGHVPPRKAYPRH